MKRNTFDELTLNSRKARASASASSANLVHFLLLLLFFGGLFQGVASTSARLKKEKKSESILDAFQDCAVDLTGYTPQETVRFSDATGASGEGVYSLSLDRAFVSRVTAAIEKGECGTKLVEDSCPDSSSNKMHSINRFAWSSGIVKWGRLAAHPRAILTGSNVEPDERLLACIRLMVQDKYPLRYSLADFLRTLFNNYEALAMGLTLLKVTCFRRKVVYVLDSPQRQRLFEPLVPMLSAFENQHMSLRTEAEAAGFTAFVAKLDAFHDTYKCAIGLSLPDNPVTLGGANLDLFYATQYLNSGAGTQLFQNTNVLLPEAVNWPKSHPLPINAIVKSHIDTELKKFRTELDRLQVLKEEDLAITFAS